MRRVQRAREESRNERHYDQRILDRLERKKERDAEARTKAKRSKREG
jgi:hypothetical protein